MIKDFFKTLPLFVMLFMCIAPTVLSVGMIVMASFYQPTTEMEAQLGEMGKRLHAFGEDVKIIEENMEIISEDFKKHRHIYHDGSVYIK